MKAMEWRAEWKYDGERLQVHADKRKKKVQLFSRSFVLVELGHSQLRLRNRTHQTHPDSLRTPLEFCEPKEI